ncbi:MAG: crotonase/enoyl-CoA hydratase family protein [Gammaproteobacteria bacterium]
MSTEPVTFDLADGVAEIAFNRPDKHNSLTLEMFEAIGEAIDRLNDTAAARVAVLSGNGPSFCAGIDLGLMQLLADEARRPHVLETLLGRDDGPDNLAQRVAYGWKTAAVPVIAAIDGVAFGGGFQIAMGADIRIASPAARFCIMETRYGLIPDMSITQTLPEHLPRDVALELTLTAREFDADEALALGLVTRVAEDPLAAARELASTVAARSPDAVRACKRLYNEAWRAAPAVGLGLEAALQLEIMGGDNQREAVAAAMERRRPAFG